MSLFSENLGIAKNDDDLASIQKQFADYHPGYICQSTATIRQKTRDWMESLWIKYEPYADKHFLKEFKRNFAQRSWELYLGVTLLNRGLKLGKSKNSGPDFDILNEKGQRLAWIEAVVPNKGDGNDKVPDTAYGIVVNVPEEEMMLRISNVLEEKFKKYLSDLKKGFVKDDEPYIVAINRSELENGDMLLPLILKVLFGIGHLTLRIKIGETRQDNPKTSWSSRPLVKKQNGQNIPMLFFDDIMHAGISGVIYCTDSIINSPRKPREMGENFVIIHNPLAKNPLPDKLFKFGDEYRVDNDRTYVNKIRKHKRYSKPGAFEFLD